MPAAHALDAPAKLRGTTGDIGSNAMRELGAYTGTPGMSIVWQRRKASSGDHRQDVIQPRVIAEDQGRACAQNLFLKVRAKLERHDFDDGHLKHT